MLTAVVAVMLLTAPPPPYESESLQHLERAVTTQRDGTHLPRIFALRQLQDERLRPVLESVRTSEDWSLRVHGVLGLAELDGALDAATLQDDSALVQEAVVANALDMGLLDDATIAAGARNSALHAFPRLILCAEHLLNTRTLPIDASVLNTLIDDDDERARALARLLLAESGEQGRLSELDGLLAELEPRPRAVLRSWMLEAIRQYRITAAAPWIDEMLSRPDLRRNDRATALGAALAIDAEAGRVAWERSLGAAPSYLDRVRFGLVLLASEGEFDAATWERLRAGLEESDPLMDALVAVGRANASGTATATALAELLEHSTPQVATWVMSQIDELPRDDAISQYMVLIDAVDDDAAPEVVARAVTATSRLFPLAPDATLRRLAAVPDDSLAQEVILLGLFDVRDLRIGDAVLKLPRLGAGRADSLALLLAARNRTSLADDDRERLGSIAAGGGRVSQGLRTQAAWLYLVHSDRWRSAAEHLSAH